jgi:uncharacterized protein YecE (DUF72 family)
MSDENLHIGTCSWKFPAWRGIVYSGQRGSNLLEEYARHYGCVEVDQWFWSLFGPDQLRLPSLALAAEYAAAVPRTFRFAVKMPNALTLTHYHPKTKTEPLVPNPHFLSPELLNRTLDALAPMREKLGPVMLQFGYLNRLMMESQKVFLERLATFTEALPKDLDWCIEPRNPQWLDGAYFELLRQFDLGHVFQQGYYMPPVARVYGQYADKLTGRAVIRLHGPDREAMDERSGKDWSRIVAPRDGEVDALAVVVRDLQKRGKKAWIFANNHFEGSAPLTIERIRERM